MSQTDSAIEGSIRMTHQRIRHVRRAVRAAIRDPGGDELLSTRVNRREGHVGHGGDERRAPVARPSVPAVRPRCAHLPRLLGELRVRAATVAGAGRGAGVRGSDTDFARDLLAQYNVTVLPGSYLAREARGFNPGAGRVRMALVADTAECLEAAQRIVQFVQSRQ